MNRTRTAHHPQASGSRDTRWPAWLLALGLVGPVSAQPVQWLPDQEGDWMQPGNWSGGALPALGAQVELRGAGRARLAVAQVQVGQTYLGYPGGGDLRVEAGAELRQSILVMGIGGGHALAEVHGAGSLLLGSSLNLIGAEGSAELRVLAGGRVQLSLTEMGQQVLGDPAGEALMRVSGSGSQAQISHLVVGTTPLPPGTPVRARVRVEDGGHLLTTGTAVVGGRLAQQARVELSGTGSRWTAAAPLQLGDASAGAIDVQDGAELETVAGAVLGLQPGVEGRLRLVGPGSRWLSTQDSVLGRAGLARLSIEAGAEWLTPVAPVIAEQASSVAEIEVQGPGSLWSIEAPQPQLAAAGSAVLVLADDAAFAVGAAADATRGLVLTADANAQGMLQIGAAGRSAGRYSAARLLPGPGEARIRFAHDQGDAWLTDSGAADGQPVALFSGLRLEQIGNGRTRIRGDQAADRGIEVHAGELEYGTGTWSMPAAPERRLRVGGSAPLGGEARLRLLAGGWLSTGFFDLSQNSESAGGLMAAGNGARLHSQNCDLAAQGEARIEVSEGAELRCTLARLAQSPSGRLLLSIRGAGSLWRSLGPLELAEQGQVEVEVANGALLDAGASRTIAMARDPGSEAVLSLAGVHASGRLLAAGVAGLGGQAELRFEHADPDAVFHQSGSIDQPPMQLSGSLSLRQLGNGSTLLTGLHTHQGPTEVAAGELRLQGAFSSSPVRVHGSGRLSASGQLQAVSVEAGGQLQRDSGGGLAMASLDLQPGAELLLQVDPQSPAAMLGVVGDLHLAGVLQIQPTAALSPGSYPLIDYGGSLSGSPALGGLPPGLVGSLDTSEPQQLRLRVEAAPALQLTPDPLDFGVVELGAEAGGLVQLQNIGGASLLLQSIQSAEPPFGPASGSCVAPPFELAPGQACTLGYRFSPQQAGLAQQSLLLQSNAAEAPHLLSLRGEGEARARIQHPAELDFGSLPRGGIGPVLQAHILSSGSAPLTLGSMQVEGEAAPGFELLVDTCSGTTLQPAQQCSLSLQARDLDGREQRATLRLPSNAVEAPQPIQLVASRDRLFADGFEMP